MFSYLVYLVIIQPFCRRYLWKQSTHQYITDTAATSTSLYFRLLRNRGHNQSLWPDTYFKSDFGWFTVGICGLNGGRFYPLICLVLGKVLCSLFALSLNVISCFETQTILYFENWRKNLISSFKPGTSGVYNWIIDTDRAKLALRKSQINSL